MSLIILGDPHIGASQNVGKTAIGAALNSRISDQINLLEFTLDQAIEQSCSNLVITGDVFEEPKPHPTLIALFVAWLKKCEAYNIHIHLIMGNHDMLRSGNDFTSSLDIISEMELNNVSVYKNIDSINIESTSFTFVPFRDKKSFGTQSNAEALSLLKDMIVYELSSIPLTYKKILIGHLAIEGSIPVGDEIDDISNEIFCPVNMFKGYDQVWMGHVHNPQVMNKKEPYVAHIGSMDISNFGEVDHKKHIVLINCNSTDLNFDIKYLPVRQLRKLTVVVPKDIDDTTNYVIEQIKNNKIDFNRSIVKVEVLLSHYELKSVNRSDIEKYLIDQGVFNVTGISESKKSLLIKQDNNINNEMDIISIIKMYAEKNIDELSRNAFIELSVDIYNNFRN